MKKFLLIIGSILIVIGLITTFWPKKMRNGKTDEVPPTADSRWEYDTLRKSGDTYHINIPLKHHLHTFDEESFYYQPEGMPKEVIGNGIGYSGDVSHVSDVDISFYQKPVVVRCQIVKNGMCTYKTCPYQKKLN